MPRLRLLLTCIFLLSFGACKESIVNDLSESNANQIILSLSEAAIFASKEKIADSWSVKVGKEDVNKALKSLNDNRVLERLSWKPQKIETSLIAGRDERHAALESMKTSRLEESIRSLPTVLEVHVHLTLGKRNGLFFDVETSRGSASVLVISLEPSSINPQQIKALVAGATGIELKDVSLLVERAFEKIDKKVVPPSVLPHKPKTQSFSFQINERQKIFIGVVLLVFSVYLFVLQKRKTSGSETSQIFDSLDAVPTNYPMPDNSLRKHSQVGNRQEVEVQGAKLEPWELTAQV